MKVPFHCTGSLYPKCTSQERVTVGRNMFFWNFCVLLILREGMGAGLLQWERLRGWLENPTQGSQWATCPFRRLALGGGCVLQRPEWLLFDGDPTGRVGSFEARHLLSFLGNGTIVALRLEDNPSGWQLYLLEAQTWVESLEDVRPPAHLQSCAAVSASRLRLAAFLQQSLRCSDLKQMLIPCLHPTTLICLLWLCSDWCHLFHCGKTPGASQIKSLKGSVWEATDNLCKGGKYYSQPAIHPWGCGLRPLHRAPALRWNGNVSCTSIRRLGKGLEAKRDFPRLPLSMGLILMLLRSCSIAWPFAVGDLHVPTS